MVHRGRAGVLRELKPLLDELNGTSSAANSGALSTRAGLQMRTIRMLRENTENEIAAKNQVLALNFLILFAENAMAPCR